MMSNRKQSPRRLGKKQLARFKHLSNNEAFELIYREAYWGGEGKSKFYSGDGSHFKDQVEPYVKAMRGWLASFNQSPVLLDAGCGDFFVGSQLLDLLKQCFACDVVSSLIEYNCTCFEADNLDFMVLDAARDKLPSADILILRQVLQHLNNEDVTAIVQKFSSYAYVVITEHVPSDDFVPNRDKVTGPDSRMRFKSGVVVTEPPFEFKPAHETCLCECADPDAGGVIRTMLYKT